MRVAGLISGTSVDGIDVAIVDIEESPEGALNVLCHRTVPYPAKVRQAILAVSNANTHTASIARLNFLLGELFAEAVIGTCEQFSVPLASVDLIGSHGQTIFHEGEPIEYLGRPIASTLQIGEPAVIAERTGIRTIGDFRTADIAAGGKGAPLVPFLDYRLFRHPTIGRIALNIGGIANFTVIPANATLDQVVAFDTGPGNMVMDALMGEAGYDRNGETARRGRVHASLLEQLLQDPYYWKSPPKTAGREQYGNEFVARFAGLNREDALATATELTVQTIDRAMQPYQEVRKVIVSGGGAHNRFLMERLRSALGRDVRTSIDYGIDMDAKEAIAFAVLAYETAQGRASNVPGATGARRPVVLGKIASPSAI
jgi:anhydro-N-acetylmuramic acid kinase